LTNPDDRIRDAIENASTLYDGGDEPDEAGPAPDEEASSPGVDLEIVAACAAFDQSDTDNGQRLRSHFGQDLAVVAADGSPGGEWVAWTGEFWDAANGHALALIQAQKIGPLMALECAAIRQTPKALAAIKLAEGFAEDDTTAAAKAARAAVAKLAKRASQRWSFSVTSKNSARIRAMLDMAAVHLRRPAKSFNADPLVFACETHTLRFVVEDDLDCPDPDVTRKLCRVEARPGHARADYLTGLVPAPYHPDATAPKFREFLFECVPDGDLRRTLQGYAGMALLGKLDQKVMFHYGSGANGKSVFLSVLTGVVGPSLSVGLPKETLLGMGERGAGQASPDLIRLFGKRLVRIDELKEGEPLREDLVKRLTGGDPMVVRAMYEGYVEFANVATPHMVGNGMPRIDGADGGIWRRVIVMPWTVTIPESRRRDFAEFVAELLAERAGILNWLIEGACDVLANGLYVAPAARTATEDYREDQDQVGTFLKACLTEDPEGRIPARQMYRVYTGWAEANAKRPFSETRFGRDVKRFVKHEKGSVISYIGVKIKADAYDFLAHAPPPAEDGR